MPRFFELMNHLHLPLVVAVLSLIAALSSLILVLILRSAFDRKLRGLLQPTTGLPGKDTFEMIRQELIPMRQTLEELGAFSHETRRLVELNARRVNEVVRVIAESRAELLTRGAQNGDNEKNALLHIYESAQSELAPFISSLSSVTSSVEALKTGPQYKDANQTLLVEETVRSYQKIQSVDSELGSKIARMSDRGSNVAVTIKDARRNFDSGSTTMEVYLREIMSLQPIERNLLPDPAAESSYYRELRAQLADTYLEWLDRINELRGKAFETESREISSTCSQIIHLSTSILEPLNVELDDIEIGKTRYDARLHDLLHTVSQSGVRPETIIGIHKLGYRRDGKTVRKPQVIVAALSN